MTNENQATNPYAAVLADLRAKRDEIDKTIKVLEGLSGLKLAVPAPLAAVGYASSGNGDGESDMLDEGAFHGMSIVDATKKLLAIRKRKMGNPEIARELAAGGLVMNSSDPVNTVGSVLTRRFNNVGDVVKVARGTWGLKEWYPNRTFKSSGKASSGPGEGASVGGEHKDLSEAYDARIAEIIGGDEGEQNDD